MLFAGVALGSLINHNLTRVEMIALPADGPADPRARHRARQDERPADEHRRTPRCRTSRSACSTRRARKAIGGDPDKAQGHFEKALEITGDKFLLARTLMAYRVGLADQRPQVLPRPTEVKVLETPPSVWPEQRLANEVAHRKARRYLSNEKELFQ